MRHAMRHAQIKQLRALKERMETNWQAQDGRMDPETASADLVELVEILLMEREGMDDDADESPKMHGTVTISGCRSA